MSDSTNGSKSGEIAGKAIERMQSEGITPTPENYELWFVYYGNSNPEVVRAIDILESNKQPLTEERCRELYDRFLSKTRQSEAVRQAGERIQDTLEGMSGTVTNVKSATSRYGSTLEGMMERMEKGEVSQEDMESILNNVFMGTKDMMNQNQALEQELSRSTEVMDELRRDLEDAKKEAFTDGLTGLANRKSFDAELERIMQDSIEEGHAFCLIMMDIDHFKSFNDNYGHQVGDQVLRLVARTLIDGIKGRDFAARYGGEEFAIILPETNLIGGVKVGDMLRQAVANKDIVNRATGEKLGNITLSGGVAEFKSSENEEELISRADAALYTAKHNGRNQIAAAPTPAEAKSQNKA